MPITTDKKRGDKGSVKDMNDREGEGWGIRCISKTVQYIFWVGNFGLNANIDWCGLLKFVSVWFDQNNQEGKSVSFHVKYKK